MSTKTNNMIVSAIESTFGGIYKASKVLDVDYTTLHRWKHNKTNPNTETIERIAKEHPIIKELMILNTMRKDR